MYRADFMIIGKDISSYTYTNWVLLFALTHYAFSFAYYSIPLCSPVMPIILL